MYPYELTKSIRARMMVLTTGVCMGHK